jgi:hypothetical protein
MRGSGAALLAAAAAAALAGRAASSYPPTGSEWARVPSNPVLRPELPWEGACVCENVALWDATRREFVMFYRGGWGSQAVGRATSADGVTWAKLPQPVYAADGKDGGEPWVHRDGADLSGTLLLYTTNNNPAHTFISASTDGGLTWAPLANASVPLPPSSSLFGNRVVWREGAQWLMLQEVMSGGPWQIFLYNSSDGVTDWAVLNGGLPLSSLQLHPGGMYGGPRFASIDGVLTPRWADGLYHLWMHCTNSSGGLPTDVYHASSKDLISWQVTPGPAVTHAGGSGFEHDQCAGPVPLTVGDKAFLYYDGDNNDVSDSGPGFPGCCGSSPPLPTRSPPPAGGRVRDRPCRCARDAQPRGCRVAPGAVSGG